MRTAIKDFALANRLYAGATVTFYTVSGGAKTATKATLYVGATGSSTLGNPQVLGSDGKLRRAVYVDVPTIATVSGLTVPDHDTGIINPAPSFRISPTTFELEYSYDGGTTWTSSASTLFKHRGAWVTATAYARTDTFTDSGTLYYTATAHTAAASLATDVSAGRVVAVSSLSLPLALTNGGTGGSYANLTALRTAMSGAASGNNTDITSLNAPSLGAATATTQAANDSSTKVATTAFAANQAAARPPVRQTVLSMAVDSNGFPAPTIAGGTGTGTTSVQITGTVRATAAAGGDADRTGSITNPSWTGLTANAYLYLDIAADGTVTTGSTTTAPVYQLGNGSISTSTGANTFVIQEMKMYEGNGAGGTTQRYRVFVGEVAASGTISSIIWYALMGRYQSALTAIPSASTRTTFSHNIGIDPRFLRTKSFIRFVTTWNGYTAGMVIPFTTYYLGTNPPTMDANVAESTLVASILNNANGIQVQTPQTGPNSYIALPTGAGTAQCYMDVQRNW